ncbi:MAG: YidC/Oxa1 family membrane protein insertase [Clostridia bacterium]|nr:YidC/Oxa1 family membrane protein insertase [Clostridia bacterium]
MEILYAPFAFIMRLFDSFTGSYAITLLLFTLLFKLVLLPLGIKQQKNQIKMAALRPKEEVIRKKYAGRTDQATMQKMQQEILELQQKENVNPMGGCLPLIIQLVLIMVIYQIIRNPLTYICNLSTESIEAIAAQIGYAGNTASAYYQIDLISAIKNFGVDTLIAGNEAYAGLANMPNLNFFGLNLGIVPSDVWGGFGTEYNLLDVVKYMIIPAACFLLQVFTMKMSRRFTYQSSVNEQAQNGCSMKMMDWMMPLMSLYFCFSFSSAIGLYWIYSNILSFGQTVLLAKLMPVPKTTEEDIKKAEKEMKAKGYDTRKPADKVRVRSLHHIDDDDYDTLPEVEGEVKGANQTLLNGEKVETKRSEKGPKVKD